MQASNQEHSGQGRAGSPAAERYAGLVMGPGVLSRLCKWLRAKWDVLKVCLPGVQMAGSQEWRRRLSGRVGRVGLSIWLSCTLKAVGMDPLQSWLVRAPWPGVNPGSFLQVAGWHPCTDAGLGHTLFVV